MKRADSIKNICFYILAGGIFVYAMSGALLATTYIYIVPGRLFFISLLLVTAFCAWFYNKYTLVAVSSVLLLCILATLLYLWHMDFDVDWYARLVDWVYELFLHVRGMTAYREEYAVLGYGIILLFAGFTSALIKTGAGFYFISALGFSVIGIMTYAGYRVDGGYIFAFLLVAVSLFALRLSRSALAHEDSGETVNANGLWLLPLCALLIAVASAVPKPPASSGFNIRQNIENNLYMLNDFMYDKFGPKYFTFSSTGFSSSGGRLGGNITPNSRHVMDVYSLYGDRPYLAGAYSDAYTGERWEVGQSGKTELEAVALTGGSWHDLGRADIVFDALISTVPNWPEPATPEYEEFRRQFFNYFTVAAPRVTIVNGREIAAVFAPANSMAIRHGEDEFAGGLSTGIPTGTPRPFTGSMYADALGAVSTQNTMDRGSYYEVSYYAQSDMREVLSESAFMREMYARYTQYTEDEALAQYLALPESLPQRVRDLAEEVTRGADTPYAKMKALETFLSQYPYTLTPGAVPVGEDFVDWFLFEGREGYCTYYASALAVMGRCVGVPTRYAEGFTLPTGEADGKYSVTNAQAHAWCDMYVPFIGWVTLEATAPYNYPFYHNGELPTLDSLDEWNENTDENFDEFLELQLRESTRPRGNGASDTEDEEDEELTSSSVALIIIFASAAVAAILWLRYYLYGKKLASLEAAPPREAAIAYFRRIAGLLETDGQTREPHETALAFARRVDGGRGLGAEGFTMEWVAEIFGRAAYSNEEITENERAGLAQCYSMLADKPNASLMERAAVWLERYLLGKY